MGVAVDAINANGGDHGPAWRHVARLGENFELLVNYPGGQQGNPFDPGYDQFVEDWSVGDYRKAVFFKTAKEAREYRSQKGQQ